MDVQPVRCPKCDGRRWFVAVMNAGGDLFACADCAYKFIRRRPGGPLLAYDIDSDSWWSSPWSTPAPFADIWRRLNEAELPDAAKRDEATERIEAAKNEKADRSAVENFIAGLDIDEAPPEGSTGE